MVLKTGELVRLSDYRPGQFHKNDSDSSFIYCELKRREGDRLTKSDVELLREMITEIHENRMIALVQVAKELPALLGLSSMEEVIEELDIDYPYFDETFSLKEIGRAALSFAAVFSVTGTSLEDRFWIRQNNPKPLFMFDYYPRPQTGLDDEVFEELHEAIPDDELIVFVPGSDLNTREGYEKTTLESHRNISSYAACLDLKSRDIDHLILTDLPEGGREAMEPYIFDLKKGIFSIPADLTFPELYDRDFKIRVDSPHALKRLVDPTGKRIVLPPLEANLPIIGQRGMITADNGLCPESGGEIMIWAKDCLPDVTMSPIGQVSQEFSGLLEKIDNGFTVRFVPNRPDSSIK